MPEFTTPVDIGNRALQQCGAEMMDPVLGFTEVSKAARQISFVYGKQRLAELERNIWTFATRRTALRPIDTNTKRLKPTVWASTTTYYRGCIVDDGSGTLWSSRIQNNLNNQPQNSSTWEPYFGPLTVSLYDSTQSYFQGELVYTTAGDGTYRVYLSLLGANGDNPATATTWSAGVTYNTAQVVTYLSVAYQSLIDLNLNQTPSASPALWSASTTYSSGQQVYSAATGLIYTSASNSNLNNDPSTDGGVHWTNTGILCPWTTVFVGGTGDIQWLEIGGAEFPMGVGLITYTPNYPIGSGPLSQTSTDNVYHKPAGFLKIAPQDPKAGSLSSLGGPTGLPYNDWKFENEFIVSSETGVIVLRFVADVQDVTRMTSLFCEMLAARIAAEVCEPLTQSTAKLGAIKQTYREKKLDAVQCNDIEGGAIEPPLDDFIACRV